VLRELAVAGPPASAAAARAYLDLVGEALS
jgi:hypothetical protein